MKRTLSVFLVAIILLSSCTSHEDRIARSSSVNQYTKSLASGTYLITTVTFQGNNYSMEADPISQLTTEEIYETTEARLTEANELLFKLKALNNDRPNR